MSGSVIGNFHRESYSGGTQEAVPTFEVDKYGNARFDGAVSVGSLTNAGGGTLSLASLSLSGTLAVTGATTLASTLAVTGAVTMASTLAVTGAGIFSSTLDVAGLLTGTRLSLVGGTLATATNALSVTGTLSTTNAAQTGVVFTITSAGSGASAQQVGVDISMVAGYSGTNTPIGFSVINAATSTNKVAIFGGLAGSVKPTTTVAAGVFDNGTTTANIFEARDNGTPVFVVANGGAVSSDGSAGTVTFGGSIISGNDVALASAGTLTFGARAQINSSADGVLRFLDAAGSAFTRVALGGITSSFPALGRSTTYLTQTLGDGTAGGGLKMSGLMAEYNNVTTAGWGVPAIYAAGTVTAQSARSAAIATYTVGAADGTFKVAGNINVSVSTTHSFSLDVDYTDETNTARTLILPMAQLAGAFVTGGLITNVTGVGPYEAPVMTLRCKAATAITIRPSAGTFTTVTYSGAATITQIA